MYKSLDMEYKTMLLACSLSVIICSVLAQEESVSINKPRTRMQQPWVQINTDHVRCFCNLPPCVATGYMCKSSSGGCFSDLLDSSRSSAYRGRHGCVEYLSESQRSRCPISNQDGQVHVQSKDHPRSLLVCCTNDLCNHVDNPNTKNLLNNTLENDTDDRFQQQDQETYLYSNSEVWFRAATIAVPICGAVILFVLIALAVKILKSEDQNSLHHKLGPAMYVVPSEQKHCQDKWNEHNYKQYLSKKPYYPQTHPNAFPIKEDDVHRPFEIPLLVEIKDVNNLNSTCNAVSESKNDANAKLNLMQCESNSSRSLILEIGKSSPNFSNTANINLNNEDKFDKSEKTFRS